MSGARARMKTILVPTEQSPTMVSALDTALLLARKFDGCIEGFPLRPAVAAGLCSSGRIVPKLISGGVAQCRNLPLRLPAHAPDA